MPEGAAVEARVSLVAFDRPAATRDRRRAATLSHRRAPRAKPAQPAGSKPFYLFDARLEIGTKPVEQPQHVGPGVVRHSIRSPFLAKTVRRGLLGSEDRHRLLESAGRYPAFPAFIFSDLLSGQAKLPRKFGLGLACGLAMVRENPSHLLVALIGFSGRVHDSIIYRCTHHYSRSEIADNTFRVVYPKCANLKFHFVYFPKVTRRRCVENRLWLQTGPL